jgi:lipopolysaccharide/colanic/teichoic acid biosynthesis glycosyltransferase
MEELKTVQVNMENTENIRVDKSTDDVKQSVIDKINSDNLGSEGAPKKTYRKSGFRYGCYLFFKRAFDIVSSGLMLIVFSPLLLILLFIKFCEDGHNPIYVSKRVGKDGKVFKFYKIRTMRVGADKEKQQLIDSGLNESDGPVFKIKNDPRITKVGRVYRKLSFDELPQLFNIFIGNMSVVGPRPPIPREVEEYTEEQMHRLDVKGGLLCLWQIQKNRNSISFEDWVKFDLEYIEKQNFWLDIKIIFKGAYMVLFDRTGE